MSVDPILLGRLEELEKTKNDGRGVCHIRTIIFFLKKKDYDSALNCCFNENDKTHQYPDIKQLLCEIFPKYGKFQREFKRLFP